MSDLYEEAKQELVEAVIVFLVEGEAAGKSQAELTAEFMAAFAQAAAANVEAPS